MDTQNLEWIEVRGARGHNLKNINVKIPRDRLTVITGPSGSGKSTLAFDTLYAEGQRRYIESLSVYARQFVEQLERPEVDSISGLSPTISIDQKTTSHNPRSTVGTATEIYDYLRLLYARAGEPFCYRCGSAIAAQSPQAIIDQILSFEPGLKLSFLAPIISGRKGAHKKLLLDLQQKGFTRIRIDGIAHDLDDSIEIDGTKKHDIEVFIDRIVSKERNAQTVARISEAVHTALRMGEGTLRVVLLDASGKETELVFSDRYACGSCGVSYPEPEPRLFSFNSPKGACPTCDGLGYEEREIEEVGDDEDTEIFIQETICPACKGERLRPEARSFRFRGMTLPALCSLAISDCRDWFGTISLTDREKIIAGPLVHEIIERFEFLSKVGVSYLQLSRSSQSLSGGESQRIRLATQIGKSMVGVIYVLDEPSIGLHPRDHGRLLRSLEHIRDRGNTVIVVEHDRETIACADWIVDIGPGAGEKGGEKIAEGELSAIVQNPKSLTGLYLSNIRGIPVPSRRRPVTRQTPKISVRGCTLNNLKDVDLNLPLGVFTALTGVSGSGKSSLIIDTLYPLLMEALYQSEVGELMYREVSGLEFIDKVVDIDQSPIGRTPRSNPATYTDLFGPIRDLFSALPESQVRGYKPGRFSFNVKGGRCETCEGDGHRKIEMHFLPNVYVQCETCKGLRYNQETLEVKYKGKSIADVLQMTAEEALDFFDAVPMLKHRLSVLNSVGLGYVRLGQSATTLSGGEAQRMKLAKELSKRSTGRTLYILDEPSTGLHFEDVQKLVHIFHQLADQGNTVVVIEHNLDIVKTADYIIDVGPEGGAAGGRIIAEGTPEEIASDPSSHTGLFLKEYLK